MKKHHLILLVLIPALLLATLGGLSTATPAQAQTRPTVPPNVDPPAPPPSGGSSDSTESSSATDEACAGLYGTAINWGFGGQGGVTLRLANGSWEVVRLSADDGNYNFGAMGTGVGLLKVESGISSLTPMIDNAAIRLSCDFHINANVGLYSGSERPVPPAQLVFSPAQVSLQPGQTVKVQLQIDNSLPNPISNVIVTSLFPKGIVVESASVSAGSVEILSERMLTVATSDVPSDGRETITLILSAADDLAQGIQFNPTATLFYAESVADQAQLAINIGKGKSLAQTVAKPTPTLTPSPEPVPTDTPVAETETQNTATLTTTTIADTDSTGYKIHIIQEGEILYEIAPLYDTTFEAIMTLNGITNPRRLQIGQQLLIPTEQETAGELVAAATGEDSAAPMPDVLPITGLGLSVSFLGIAFGLIALLSRGIRSVRNRKS